jgi:hypothetical protein
MTKSFSIENVHFCVKNHFSCFFVRLPKVLLNLKQTASILLIIFSPGYFADFLILLLPIDFAFPLGLFLFLHFSYTFDKTYLYLGDHL